MGPEVTWTKVIYDENEGVIAIGPGGERIEIPQKFSKKALRKEVKDLPSDILSAMRTVARFVLDDPQESFGIGQFAEHLVYIDDEVPSRFDGREDDILPNACANAMRLGFSARESAEQVLLSYETVRKGIKMGDIDREEYDKLLNKTTEVLVGFYPANSPNRRKR